MKTTDNVLVASPSETLDDIIPKLNKVTGLPVIDSDGACIGVISRKVRSTEFLRWQAMKEVHQVALAGCPLAAAPCSNESLSGVSAPD